MTDQSRRYELIGTLAENKTGAVQLALRRGGGDEKLVAIKTVKEDAPEAVVIALRNEATVLGWIKHPGVVEIRDFGQVAGRYVLVMEYLDGHSLLEVASAGRDGNRLDILSTARVIARASEALHALHEQRDATGAQRMDLVHNDVSLGNIMVLYDGRTKLIDFGFVKEAETKPREIHGKLDLMAPEKLRGSPADRRSDLFSLGCTTWQALTLEPLFRGRNDAETTARVLTMPVRPPSEVNSNVPREFDAIVMPMLERDPDKRCASAGHVADEIDAVLRSRDYPEDNGRIEAYMTETFRQYREERARLIVAVRQKIAVDDGLPRFHLSGT